VATTNEPALATFIELVIAEPVGFANCSVAPLAMVVPPL